MWANAGAIDMVLKYGHPGKETNEINITCKVTIVMEHYGFVSQLSFDVTKQAQSTA
jgi:hypothetical protein